MSTYEFNENETPIFTSTFGCVISMDPWHVHETVFLSIRRCSSKLGNNGRWRRRQNVHDYGENVSSESKAHDRQPGNLSLRHPRSTFPSTSISLVKTHDSTSLEKAYADYPTPIQSVIMRHDEDKPVFNLRFSLQVLF